MTLRQSEYAKAACRHQRISVQNLAEDTDRVIRDVVSWATETQSEPKPLLIYTSETVEDLTKNRNDFGGERTGLLCEHALAEIASSLVDNGVGQLIVAGGDLSRGTGGNIGAGVADGWFWTRRILVWASWIHLR